MATLGLTAGAAGGTDAHADDDASAEVEAKTVDDVVLESYAAGLSEPPVELATAAPVSEAEAAADVNASLAALSAQRSVAPAAPAVGAPAASAPSALAAPMSTAFGYRILTSPFGTEPVRVVGGLRQATGEYVVIWQSKMDLACAEVVIGDANGLQANTVLITPNASGATTLFQNDVALPQAIGSLRITCEGVASSLVYGAFGGRTLDIVGGASSDFIHGGAGETAVLGGGGNDRLISVSDKAIMLGGGGDDALLSLAREGSDEFLLGGGGNDCVFDVNLSAAVVLCGSGEDKLRTNTTSKLTLSCETPTTGC